MTFESKRWFDFILFLFQTAVNRVGAKRQMLLDRWVESLPHYIRLQYDSKLEKTTDILVSLYEETSKIAVFTYQMERYEISYDGAQFVPQIRELHRILKAEQCQLAIAMVNRRLVVPHVSMDAIGQYDALAKREDRHDFGYLVLRDTQKVLMNHINRYDDLYMSTVKDSSSTNTSTTKSTI